MANTYTLISSNTLSSSAASVTFSSIPGTYTDLVLKISGKVASGGASENILLEYNGSAGTDYSATYLQGTGSATFSGRNSSTSSIRLYNAISSLEWNNAEIYIPSYLASQNKPVSAFTVTEQNLATDCYIVADAGLWRSTNAITSIKISSAGANFVSGSSFYLYGIKNS
jgi:hypothetical protein